MKKLQTIIGLLLFSVMLAFAGPGDVNVAWDANDAEDNVTKYNVYYGRAPGVYDGSVEVASVPQDMGGVMTLLKTLNLEGGKYFSAVTAVSDIGLESGYSNEISIVMPKTPANYRKNVSQSTNPQNQ